MIKTSTIFFGIENKKEEDSLVIIAARLVTAPAI